METPDRLGMAVVALIAQQIASAPLGISVALGIIGLSVLGELLYRRMTT